MEKHFTATVVLVSSGNPRKVLLGLHKKLGVWLPPGGHIDSGETPIEAAIRETKEEAGIDVSGRFTVRQLEDRVARLQTPDYFFEETIPEHNGTPEHRHLDFVYVLSGVPESDFVQNQIEMTDMRWFTRDELFDPELNIPLYPNLKDIILTDIFRSE